MDTEAHRKALIAQAKAALSELNDLITQAAPDQAKEAIADEFNRLSTQIDTFGGWGSEAP